MYWDNKRYISIDYHYKKIFNDKVYKLSLDAGFTCPNRDGKVGYGGCIFCSEKGSGDNASSRNYTIADQLKDQKEFIKHKVKSNKYIAYFQAYTNTYSDPENLRYIYNQALSDDEVVGISIATRPDCIDDNIILVIREIANKKRVWVELGLQTFRDDVANLINRGYETRVFYEAVEKLSKINVEIVVHLIIGLPLEQSEDILRDVKLLNNLPIHGVKFHLLHILKNTKLAQLYEDSKFHIYEFEEYCDLLIECIHNLRPDIIIHRLTGDGPKELLIAPMWSLKKINVINYINHKMKILNTYQGCKYE